MIDRYPGYDVLDKRDTPSWNDITRRVVQERLDVPRTPRFFDEAEWATLCAVCEQIVPQRDRTEKVPLPSYVDQKMFEDRRDGYRYPGMPPQGEAWRRGLAALDEVARREHGVRFHEAAEAEQNAILTRMQKGEVTSDALGDMPPDNFFSNRVIHDIVRAYYAHPDAWSEIGWGGPASPRGYVRLDLAEADPWEPVEAKPGTAERARRRNQRVG